MLLVYSETSFQTQNRSNCLCYFPLIYHIPSALHLPCLFLSSGKQSHDVDYYLHLPNACLPPLNAGLSNSPVNSYSTVGFDVQQIFCCLIQSLEWLFLAYKEWDGAPADYKPSKADNATLLHQFRSSPEGLDSGETNVHQQARLEPSRACWLS